MKLKKKNTSLFLELNANCLINFNMKFCCDRYSIGITIGSIYILASVVIFVLGCIAIGQYDQIEDPERVKRLKSEGIKDLD